MSTISDMGTYISAREAATRARLHPDYISRLARESKILSRRVGRRWYVDPKSLDAFLEEQSVGKEAWRQELKEKRRTEYKKPPVHEERERLAAPIAHIEEKLAETTTPQVKNAVEGTIRYSALTTPGVGTHMASYVIHPGVDFLHRLIALMTAIVLVFGTYALIDREFGSTAASLVARAASNLAAVSVVAIGGRPDCTSGAQRFVASATSALRDVIAAIDAVMPSGIERMPSASLDPCFVQ